MIGDCETAALVGRSGSIDWLCLPRFDSDSCFAKRLGSEDNGSWRIAPTEHREIQRHYQPGTLILETTFKTDGGRVRVTDFMPPKSDHSRVVRIVEGLEGKVEMRCELAVRFEYGNAVPWVSRLEDGALSMVAGGRGDRARADQGRLRTALRYVEHQGWPAPGEGMFLACSFWLADAYHLIGREAQRQEGGAEQGCRTLEPGTRRRPWLVA